MTTAPVLFAGGLLVTLLAGCGSSPCPTLAPDLAYCLRSPDSGPHLATLQQVTVEAGTQAETLLVRAENGSTRLVVVGLSPLGQTLLSSQWDGQVVTRAAAMPGQPLDAAAMLALVQIGMWPLETLRAGFDSEVRFFVDGAEDRLVFRVIRVMDAGDRTLLELERIGQAPPFSSTRIALPTAGIVVRSRTLTESEPTVAPQ
jgi:hypothetical protein